MHAQDDLNLYRSKCIYPFPLRTNLQQTSLKTTEQKYEQPTEIEFKLLSRSENNVGSDQPVHFIYVNYICEQRR